MGGLLREGERVKFEFIRAEKANFPVRFMCKRMDISASGFYAWCRRPESNRAREDRRLAVLAREAHEASDRAYGSPRVYRALKDKGIPVSRKRVMRLMKEQGLKGKGPPRRFVRTTDSNHSMPIAPNILARNFQASLPNQRWVGDITYLRTPDGWLYLAAILDLYSRFVVGWAVSPIIDRELTLKALDMALKRRCPDKGLVHHTDRGSQYASGGYQQRLEENGIVCSMSRRGDCYDNAPMESWFGRLKTELGEDFESEEAARRELFRYIEVFYNQKRLHSSLGYVSPADFERRATGAAA
jgi:putative transposase